VLRSGERVRVTAQLIKVPVERHVWAESFEGDLRDTLALQNRVARAIAEQIRATASQQEQAALQNPKVVNPEAYEAYLKGRYFWNKRTGDGLKKAIDYFDRAIEKDPNFAKAYTGLVSRLLRVIRRLGIWDSIAPGCPPESQGSGDRGIGFGGSRRVAPASPHRGAYGTRRGCRGPDRS